MTKIRIQKAKCNYEKEPLISSYGFKGSALTCLWQTAVLLETENTTGLGLGVQSVLWSDAEAFHALGEEAGNKAMFQLTEFAVKLCEGMELTSPFQLLDAVFPKTFTYAKQLLGRENLRATFVLNALVPLDLAVWQLWARETGMESFDEIDTFEGQHHMALANIPAVGYSVTVEEVKAMAENGVSLFKIKTGSDPLNNNDPEEMLRWDQKRMLEIHEAVKDIRTPDTVCGHVLYYVDANGRYDTKERLRAFLDFAEEKGFLDRIVLVEEPFDESNKTDVRDLPVCIAADESAHSLEDVQERFELGYRALTLKPIAKTLSMTIRMAEFAREQGMICLCADLTVNPVMLSWNHCVASRLKPIPQMKLAALESNGEQNYLNWQTMWGYHPCSDDPLVRYEKGIFRLAEGFHTHSGGVFQQSEHFLRLFEE